MIENFTLSTKLILEDAKRRGIEIIPMESRKVVGLRFKKHEEFLFYQFISNTSSVAHQICHHKDLLRKFLLRASLSVSEGSDFSAKLFEEGLEFFKKMKKPAVLKPATSTHGYKVFVGIKDELTFEKSWKDIKKIFKTLVLEEMFVGNEYRIFATKEKVVGITHRVPANVVGDGVSSIRELIKMKNSDPKRGKDYNTALLRIKIDQSLKDYLAEQNLNLESIPKKGNRIYLRKTSNLSTGGDSIDYTDKVHPSVKEIAVKAINAVPGLTYGGIDFMTKDITKRQTKDSYIIIEINASPMISMHHFPHEGMGRDVAKEIIDLAFPETKGL